MLGETIWYGLALVSTAMIIFVAVRLGAKAMKRAGWIGKRKEQEPPKEEKFKW